MNNRNEWLVQTNVVRVITNVTAKSLLPLLGLMLAILLDLTLNLMDMTHLHAKLDSMLPWLQSQGCRLTDDTTNSWAILCICNGRGQYE